MAVKTTDLGGLPRSRGTIYSVRMWLKLLVLVGVFAFQGSGHFMMVEDPDRFYSVLDGFLEQIGH